jgi:catechol 2,3-dioxygenase-like lactoylglutathione lyase family enzyme
VIGRFHEVSVHAPDLLASLAFYERLGFTQVTAGEAFAYPYAVVADGRLAIGLHGHELPQSPLLSFVLPGLLEHLATLERRGIEILDRRLGNDVFNEASLEAGGQALRLLEARTHSPTSLGPGETSRLGWFEEYALPVGDLKVAEAAFERLGFVPAEEGDEPYPHIGMTSDTLNVALLGAGSLKRPALVFTDAAMHTRIAELRESGIDFARRPPAALDADRHALLVAPEGTQLLLTTSDA